MGAEEQVKSRTKLIPFIGKIRTTIHKSFRSPREFSGARVAQIFNLLYRRFSTCGARDKSGVQGGSCVLPIANRRYSRVQLCATLVAASPRCEIRGQQCVFPVLFGESPNGTGW
jgi:hypothetical protein